MSTPSLLNIPYLYKAGTLYSQTPESGAGDFTVQRTTTVANRSTRINRAGLIELVADNVPRLDYPVGGAVNGCPALLVEPSAQNFFWPSDDFANGISTPSAFGLNDFGSGSVSNTSATLDPFGTNLADYIQENSASGIQHRALFSARPGMVSGTTYTASVFAKAAQRTRFRLYNNAGGGGDVSFDLSNGTITAQSGIPAGASPRIENYGNGWFRCSLPYTPSVSALFNVIGGLLDASGNAVYNGTGTQGLYIFGLQIEVGSVPTSYIPTTTAVVTRSGEIITDTTASALIGQSEGTLYAEVDVRNLGISRSFMNVQDTSYATNAVRIESQGNNWRIQIRAASATILDQTIASPAFTTGIYKVAFAYSAAANGVAFAVNGTIIYTNASALTMPSGMDRVHLGTRITGGSFDLFLNDRIRATELHPNRLTNAQLATLTAL